MTEVNWRKVAEEIPHSPTSLPFSNYEKWRDRIVDILRSHFEPLLAAKQSAIEDFKKAITGLTKDVQRLHKELADLRSPMKAYQKMTCGHSTADVTVRDGVEACTACEQQAAAVAAALEAAAQRAYAFLKCMEPARSDHNDGTPALMANEIRLLIDADAQAALERRDARVQADALVEFKKFAWQKTNAPRLRLPGWIEEELNRRIAELEAKVGLGNSTRPTEGSVRDQRS